MKVISNVRFLSHILRAFLIIGIVSCSDFKLKNTEQIDTDQITYHNKIKSIVDSKCVTCHQEAAIGGFELTSYESVVEKCVSIRNSVEKRVMPPWLASAEHKSYKDNLSLTEDERQTLLEWFGGDMPVGKPLNLTNPTDGRDHELENLSTSLTVVKEEDHFIPDLNLSDEYRCFVNEFPSKVDSFVTAFRAVPGNPEIVHHLVSYVVSPELGQKLVAAQGRDGRKGYACFGGPLPSNKSEILTKDPEEQQRNREQTYWLAHWAPGMFGSQFPEDTGIFIAANSMIVTQIHYYTVSGKGEADKTSEIWMNLASEVEKPAIMAVTSKVLPEGEKRMILPIGKAKTYSGSRKLSDYFDRIKGLANVGDGFNKLEIHSANLHMHAIGSEAQASLEFEDGSTDVLLEIKDWDLRWQRDFYLEKPIVFTSEEMSQVKLKVSCTFMNFRDFEVVGGLGSDDEMCLNFSYLAISK